MQQRRKQSRSREEPVASPLHATQCFPLSPTLLQRIRSHCDLRTIGGRYRLCCGCLPLILSFPCSQPYFPLSLKINSRLFRKIPFQGSPQVCPPQVWVDLIAKSEGKQQKADGRDACHDPGHRKYPTFTPTVASKGSASSPHIPPRPT